MSPGVVTVSFAQRLGAYFGAVLHRLGATPFQVAIAEVIGGALAVDTGEGVYVSTRALSERCFDRGVTWSLYHHAPSYGQIAAVLELLDDAGLATWKRAHVRRWHGEAAWPIPRPIQTAPATKTKKAVWRNPVRCVRVIGHAAAFLAGLALASTVAAMAAKASPIVTPGNNERKENQTTSRLESGYTVTSEGRRKNRNAPLSIEDASQADAVTPSDDEHDARMRRLREMAAAPAPDPDFRE